MLVLPLGLLGSSTGLSRRTRNRATACPHPTRLAAQLGGWAGDEGPGRAAGDLGQLTQLESPTLGAHLPHAQSFRLGGRPHAPSACEGPEVPEIPWPTPDGGCSTCTSACSRGATRLTGPRARGEEVHRGASPSRPARHTTSPPPKPLLSSTLSPATFVPSHLPRPTLASQAPQPATPHQPPHQSTASPTVFPAMASSGSHADLEKAEQSQMEMIRRIVTPGGSVALKLGQSGVASGRLRLPWIGRTRPAWSAA